MLQWTEIKIGHSNIYSNVADEESPPFKSGQSSKKFEWIKNKRGPNAFWASREDDFECSKRPSAWSSGERNFVICTARRLKRNFCHNKCNDDVCNRDTKRKERCQSENVYGAKKWVTYYNIEYSDVRFRCGYCRPITLSPGDLVN